MQLAIITAVILSLAFADKASQPVGDPFWRTIVVIALGLSVLLFAGMIAGTVAHRLRRYPRERDLWLKQYDIARQLMIVYWLGTVSICASWVKWASVVRFDWGLDHWILLDDLLVLAPVVLPLLTAWAALFEGDRAAVGYSAEDRITLAERCKYVGLLARAHLLLVLLPVLMLCAALDLQTLWSANFASTDSAGPVADGTVHSWGIWPLTIGLLLVLVVAFPWILLRIWPSRSLPDSTLRRRLEAAGKQSGASPRDILVWNTSGRVANAVVAGMLPGTRYVFLTDALVKNLSEDEIESVYRHELAHVRRFHLPLRLAAVLAPTAWWMFLSSHSAWAEEWFGWHAPAWFTQWSAGLVWLPAIMLGLVTAGLLAWYSRLLEHDADLSACTEKLNSGAGEGSTLALSPTAAEHLIGALGRLAWLTGSDPRRASWLHPSTSRRVELVRQLQDNPVALGKFRRRMQWLSLAMIAVLLFPAICQWVL